MKKLKSILKVKSRTSNMILLEVKPDSQIDLIEHGFEGDEKLFRLWFDDKSNYTWDPPKFYTSFRGEELKASGTYEWGPSCTCGSDSWRAQRNKIIDVAKEFGFDIQAARIKK